MLLTVHHQTRYEFDQPVFLEPHLLRLVPATNHRQKLIEHNVKIIPGPSGFNDLIDPEGNLAQQIWFEDETSGFEVVLDCTVEMLEHNPFAFLIHPIKYSELNFQYPQELHNSLLEYRSKLLSNPEMEDYVASVKSDSENAVLPFLSNLTNRIYHDFKQELRQSGEPHSPDKTFELKKGSCRDLVWMLISMARHLGCAARFASGYLYAEKEEESELHAWAEFYLMGGGWVGMDPTSGLSINQNYIWTSASSVPENTLPVSGNYRGDAASKLKTRLSIKMS